MNLSFPLWSSQSKKPSVHWNAEVDWKKLNRDATFKKKYKARSGEIQDILADMLNTFIDNRNEAVAAEEKAQSAFFGERR